MIVSNTTDKIEMVLGANATTNQLQIYATYNQISSTAVTPVKNSLTSSNTTAVTIVPQPSSGNQHQLKYCNIFNTDNRPATITVRTNYNGTTRNAISTTLQVNEYVQYTHKVGWKAFDMNGSLKTSTGFYDTTDGKYNELVLSANNSTNVTLTSTPICIYLGRATAAYTTMMVQHYVGSPAASGITWAEMAIYKGTADIGSTVTVTRAGFADTSVMWLGQANQYRFATISVSGIQAGDDLWVVFAISATGGGSYRSHTIADNIGAGFIGNAPAGTRPSLSSSINITPSTTQVQPFVVWNGIQQ